MHSRKAAHALVACASILLCLPLTAGCGHNARSLKLDKETARQSLSAFLDCWKSGGEPGALQSRSPAIIGRDTDWDNGKKLVQFTLGAETDDGTNMHITTELVLASGGRQATKAVEYIVGTSPAITVFRNE
jgi:hypothetical protein